MAEEKSYRIYVTDILKAKAEGKSLTARWAELTEHRRDFDAEAVAESVIARAGLVVNHDEPA